jgi:hypothetical protein
MKTCSNTLLYCTSPSKSPIRYAVPLVTSIQDLHLFKYTALLHFSTQVKYSAFGRELLACVDGFWHLLEGRQFTIYTDHKLLTYALCRPSDPWSARQRLDFATISEHQKTDMPRCRLQNLPPSGSKLLR